MKKYLFILLGLIAGTLAHATDSYTDKKNVTLWYEAFDKNNPALIDNILSEHWEDIPAAPGQAPGPEGAKHILSELAKTFPDFRITIKQIFQDGNKVIVQSEITATQNGTFMGFPTKHRKMDIMAVDIHEFKDGKIVRTWHMEDWMTGLRQLGIFDKP